MLGPRNDKGKNMEFLPSGSSQPNRRDSEADKHLQCSVIGAGRVGPAGHFSGNLEDQVDEEALTGGEGDNVEYLPRGVASDLS